MLPLLLLLASADARTLLFTESVPSTAPACLRDTYHGTFGGVHVYQPDEGCAFSSAAGAFDSGALVPRPSGGEIVWVGHAGVEGVARSADVLKAGFEEVAAQTELVRMERGHSQVILMEPSPDDESIELGRVSTDEEMDTTGIPRPHLPTPGVQMLHLSDSGMFIRIPHMFLHHIDKWLPRHLSVVGVPPSPVPQDYNIPKHYARHLANVTASLEYNPEIAGIVDTLSSKDIRNDVRYLTGEDSDIESRHSFTSGARVAAQWIKNKVEATGAECEFFPFLPGFSPDVICTYPSLTNSTERVILSGHYDSRGSFGNLRAPGADDDGSGTAHVLAVADAIAAHNLTFERPLTLALFSGEEQGLWGSHYYAKHLAEQNASVILHIQADMLAYRVPGEPMQLGLPETIELPEAGYLVANISALYAPELEVGRTAACCSDHQSFLTYGFPATQVFERNGWIADPMYHNSGDVSDREGYDFEQIRSIATVTFATVLEVAGYRRAATLRS